MKTFNKNVLLRLLICSATLLIILFFIANIYINIRFENRIFESIHECEASNEYVIDDLLYSSFIEPEKSVISNRWAKSMMYEEKTYKFFAYEFTTEEHAKSFYEKVSGKKGQNNFGSFVNFQKKTPLITFYENKLYMIFYNDSNYREIARFVNVVTESFTHDVDEMIVNSNK